MTSHWHTFQSSSKVHPHRANKQLFSPNKMRASTRADCCTSIPVLLLLLALSTIVAALPAPYDVHTARHLVVREPIWGGTYWWVDPPITYDAYYACLKKYHDVQDEYLPYTGQSVDQLKAFQKPNLKILSPDWRGTSSQDHDRVSSSAKTRPNLSSRPS